MKTTYLVRQKKSDGTVKLVEITGVEWYELAKQNALLPPESRRYFIRDSIVEGKEIDTMVIEVEKAEYRAWKTGRQSPWRSQKAGERFSICSLDAPCVSDEGDEVNIEDVIAGSTGADNDCYYGLLSEDLRKTVSSWKPWASDLLDLYLSGHRRDSTAWLANECGVSEQYARRLKRQFEDLIKKFLS